MVKRTEYLLLPMFLVLSMLSLKMSLLAIKIKYGLPFGELFLKILRLAGAILTEWRETI